MKPYNDRWDRQFIAGEWTEGSGKDTIENTNPYDDSPISSITSASKKDVETAYKAARHAQRKWAKKLPQERARVIETLALLVEERKEELLDWLVRESGSTRFKAGAELDNAIGIIKESASFPMRLAGHIFPSPIPGKESRVYREPVGVVGVISPWNFPFHLAMRSLAPAIATGNAVVLKPASDTPITGGLILGKLFEEAGLPPGVLNVVVGSGSEIGSALVEHPIPSLISFTGSTSVGRDVAETAGRCLKKVALELGGNNAMIVMPDADVKRAAMAAVVGSYLHQGQICIALNRVLVHASMYDDFLSAVKHRAMLLKTGDPSKKLTFIGPIINDDQKEKILEIVQKTEAEGARKILGGEVEGRVIHPVLFADVTREMTAFKEEVFGPVCSVIKYDSVEEAIELANDTAYGLSGAVFGGDIEHAEQVALQVHTGMIHVNDQSVNDDPNAAFGGVGDSGLGRFGGEWAMREFTRERWMTVQHEPRKFLSEILDQ